MQVERGDFAARTAEARASERSKRERAKGSGEPRKSAKDREREASLKDRNEGREPGGTVATGVRAVRTSSGGRVSNA